MLSAVDKLTASARTRACPDRHGGQRGRLARRIAHAIWHAPDVVVLPHSAAEVAEIITIAREFAMPVTARGLRHGTCRCVRAARGRHPHRLSGDERILEIDVDNQVAVVQPGVNLRELDEATARHGLVYPVFPGESRRKPGRHRGDQRRRHARREIRGHATSGPRASKRCSGPARSSAPAASS